MHKILKRWRLGTKSAQARLSRWDRVAAVYRTPPLEPLTQELCSEVLADEARFQQLQRQAKVVIIQGSRDQILHSMVYRYPVYFGKPMSSMYDAEALSRALGLNEEGFNQTLHNEARYVICGPAWSRETNFTLWVVHAWSVNLETKRTGDYQRLMGGGQLDRALYQQLVFQTHVAILAAIRQCPFASRTLVVHMPLLGLGVFLQSISHHRETIAFAIRTFLDGLVHAWEAGELTLPMGGRVKLRLVVRTQDRVGAYLLHYIQSQGPKTWLHVDLDGDLFQWPQGFADARHCLVNAWDPHSFIGNGGVLDETVDGLLVSGHGGLHNTSYLHNPFFATSLLKSREWLNFTGDAWHAK